MPSNFPDDECRTCTGILYAYNNVRSARKLQPVCIGFEKKTGKLAQSQIPLIHKKGVTFSGTVISIGVSQYCGRMIRFGKLPVYSGFQIVNPSKTADTGNKTQATPPAAGTVSPNQPLHLENKITNNSNSASTSQATRPLKQKPIVASNRQQPYIDDKQVDLPFPKMFRNLGSDFIKMKTVFVGLFTSKDMRDRYIKSCDRIVDGFSRDFVKCSSYVSKSLFFSKDDNNTNDKSNKER